MPEGMLCYMLRLSLNIDRNISEKGCCYVNEKSYRHTSVRHIAFGITNS